MEMPVVEGQNVENRVAFGKNHNGSVGQANFKVGVPPEDKCSRCYVLGCEGL